MRWLVLWSALVDPLNHDIDEHVADNFSLLRSRIRRLPPIHQATMQALVEHLARVVSRSDKNKMSSKNLATVFGPLIFGEDQIPGGAGVQGIQLSKVSWRLSSRSWSPGLLMNLLGYFDGGPPHEFSHLVPTD